MFEPCLTDIEIILASTDCVFKVNDTVRGEILIKVHREDAPLHHNGITLSAVGSVRLQLSEKDSSLLDQLFATVDPIEMMDVCLELKPPGKLPIGTHAIPFAFALSPTVFHRSTYYDGYRAVSAMRDVYGQNVQVVYGVEVEIMRPLLSGGSISTGMCEFLVESRAEEEGVKRVEQSLPRKFALERFDETEEDLKTKKKKSTSKEEENSSDGNANLKEFEIRGELSKMSYFIEEPIEGFVEIISHPRNRKNQLKKIEVELERVETVISAEGTRSTESSAVQFTQIVDDGADVSENVRVPIHVTFPRLYACPSVVHVTFSVGFAAKIIATFDDGVDDEEDGSSKTTFKKKSKKKKERTSSISIPISVHRAPNLGSGEKTIL
ncbi:unnamed protein product [Bathycoccus prasinos]